VTRRAWDLLWPEEQREMLDYLHRLPLNIDLQVGERNYRLVHGAPVQWWETNTDHMYRTAAHFAVWRRLKAEEPAEVGRILIFGHTPTHYFQTAVPMEIWYGKDRIGIDCGCGWPEDGPEGRLGCLRLDDGAEFYVK
jgi:serine/threonine protein phosphatase 1